MSPKLLLTVTPLAAAFLVACAKGEQTSQSTDATARNLTLAPTESTAAVRDVPAPTTEPAQAAPERKAPIPKRAAPPAPPAPLMLAAGTHLPLAAQDTITTRGAKAGDPFSASVSQDVKDREGRVVIPAGAAVAGTIAAAEAAHPNSTGILQLNITSVTVRGVSYPIEAAVVTMDTVRKGRGVTAGDAEKAGAGAAAGAIVGRLLGKDTKGALIGGALGAAAGAAVAHETRSIDVIIPKGAAITIALTKPLVVKRG
jgi:Glycine zipper 2TM domain